MSAQAPRNDEAFPTYRNGTADRDRALRRVRQVTALLGVGAAVGGGAFAVGLALGSTPATPVAGPAVARTPAQPPARPPASLSGFPSEEGDDGGWHRFAASANGAGTHVAPTAGGGGSATTSGGSTAVAVP